METRAGFTGDSGPESFADVIKKTINKVKISKELDMRVRDHGQTRVVRKEEVLLLKPRCPEGISAMPSPVSVGGVTNVLKSIPVNRCLETSRGSVVLKFPYGEAKAEARAFVGSSADFMDVTVSEPRKILPKMALIDVPPSLSDGEIVSGIHDINPKIKKLLNA